MDTLTRRELFRRLGRAAVVGPLVLATRDDQSILLYRLSRLFGPESTIGHWFEELWIRW